MAAQPQCGLQTPSAIFRVLYPKNLGSGLLGHPRNCDVHVALEATRKLVHPLLTSMKTIAAIQPQTHAWQLQP